MIWSKAKRLLQTLAARTIDDLHDAFASAYAAVTSIDIRNCFAHRG